MSPIYELSSQTVRVNKLNLAIYTRMKLYELILTVTSKRCQKTSKTLSSKRGSIAPFST